MLPKLNYLPVHWVDGMKITRSHFTDFERYVTDQTRDVASLGITDYTYGLLPADPDSGFNVQVQVYPQQVDINVFSCRAITTGGYRIEVNERNPVTLRTTTQQILSEHNLPPDKEYTFAIVLSVNPFDRIPVGEPTPGEIPPRHPYTLPAYQLSLIPAHQMNDRSFDAACLILGKLQYRHQELKQQADYIPACASVASHPALLHWYRTFGNLLSELETSAIKIIQKVKSRAQSSALADSIHHLAEKLVFALAVSRTAYRWMVPQQPPIQLMEHLLNVVHTCKTAIDCLTGKEREELLGYFAEWSEVTPGVIESKINHLTQVTYSHTDITPLLTATDDFFRMITELFSKLSQLEYIGKRKGQVVFIIENPVVDPPVPKPRWSPL